MAIRLPEPISTTAPPTRAGRPSLWPVTDMRPLNACIKGSYPGRFANGPSEPYPVREA